MHFFLFLCCQFVSPLVLCIHTYLTWSNLFSYAYFGYMSWHADSAGSGGGIEISALIGGRQRCRFFQPWKAAGYLVPKMISPYSVPATTYFFLKKSKIIPLNFFIEWGHPRESTFIDRVEIYQIIYGAYKSSFD